jgi:8-oxo-dGTP pyrophosphatase MutT (NUDIX family)
MPKPFERQSREVLVDNEWHRYCHDRYVRTDGSVGSYYYIDMHGACGIIPLFEDGSTAILRVRRYLLGETLWEFPIGGMAEGESPLDAAQKELRQEAGLVAADWQALGRFAPYKGVSNELTHFFLARDLTATAQDLEPTEQITVHRMPLEEARARILEQEIGDGQSLAGLMLLDRFLARA